MCAERERRRRYNDVRLRACEVSWRVVVQWLRASFCPAVCIRCAAERVEYRTFTHEKKKSKSNDEKIT